MSSRARIMLKERDDRASPAICPDGSCRVFLATPVKIERVVSSDAPSPVPRPPSSDDDATMRLARSTPGKTDRRRRALASGGGSIARENLE